MFLGQTPTSSTPTTPASGSAGGLQIATKSTSSMVYPDPFFNLANQYLPTNLQDTFRWCRFYFYRNSTIQTIVVKLATYSMTDVVVEEQNPGIRGRWEELLLEKLAYNTFRVNVGLDYHCFGNAFVSIAFPFVKILRCRQCGRSTMAGKADYEYTNFQFRLTCAHCGYIGMADVDDHYVRAADRIRLVRWNPEYLDIETNEVSATSVYHLNLPTSFYNDLAAGRKELVETTPQKFLDAAKDRRSVAFSADNLFHMKRASISGEYPGWGVGRLMPVLQDAFYLQLMRRAQEAILAEHIVPLRILYPEVSAAGNPLEMVSMSRWKAEMTSELNRWRKDPNLIPLASMPVGYQRVGGDGRQILLVPELETMNKLLCNAMGMPAELIFGGVSWSGSNVSLRMMENDFLRYNEQQLSLLRWTIHKLSLYLDWTSPTATFKPFKMADDLQRMSFFSQLKQSGDLSRRSLVTYAGFDVDAENKMMAAEAADAQKAMTAQKVAEARAQGEAQAVMGRHQMKLQQQMMAEQTRMAEESQTRLMADQSAAAEASMLSQMQMQTAAQSGTLPPIEPTRMSELVSGLAMPAAQPADAGIQSQAKSVVAYIRQHPERRPEIMAGLGSQLGQTVGQMLAPSVDDRPLPVQRPPRRATPSI